MGRAPACKFTPTLDTCRTHSPCVHCASCTLLFPEVCRVVYGREENCLGIEILQEGGVEVERLPRGEDPQDRLERFAWKSRPRPMPPPSKIQLTELIDSTGRML